MKMNWIGISAARLAGMCLLAGSFMPAFAGTQAPAPDRSNAEVIELRTLMDIGQYDKLEAACRLRLAEKSRDGAIFGLLGEVLEIRGRYAEARQSYEQGIASNPGDYRTRLNLARLLRLTGARAAARKLLSDAAADLTSLSLRTAGEETFLGEALHGLERFHESNQAYQRALKNNAGYVQALILRGRLFAEKQDLPYAKELLKQALDLSPKSAEAMAAMAEVLAESATGEAESMAKRALEVNPNFLDTHLFLARRSIQSELHEEADKRLRKAAEINPNHPQLLGLQAIVCYFRDQDADYARMIEKIRQVSSSFPEVYNDLSEVLGGRYRYQEAADFARQAIQQEPQFWPAHANLGINLLRLGDLKGGKKELETAFEHDPFDVRVKNTLDLLDQLETYHVLQFGDFRVLLHPAEAEVMGPYVRDLLEQASTKLTARFGYRPQGPVQVEVYPNHADFAVRTMGLPGIGALGACFGRVVVMDSPRAQKRGEYTWGSTLWHEYIHVLSLEKSNHRIPRWMSEGLSVMEERRGRPGWGDNLNLALLQAIKEDKMLDLARLNDGFHRPSNPFQIVLSYYQASKVCEYLELRYGWAKILAMLEAYGRKWDTERIFREVLGADPAEFDRSFRDHLKKEIAVYLNAVDFDQGKKLQSGKQSRAALEEALKANPGEFFVNLTLGRKRYEENDWKGAEECWVRARKAFPFYAEEDSPYLMLADLYEKQKRPDLAMEQLTALLQVAEGGFPVAMRLAKLSFAGGKRGEAESALVSAAYMDPFDQEMHGLFGNVLLEAGKHRESVREFQVLLALNPTDKAGAYFDLSRAYLAAGLKAQAKNAVLKALEIAPSFPQAQELLLKIAGD